VSWLVERVVLASARQEVVEMRRITLVLGRVSKVGVSREMLPAWDEET
jgi:hypothetical protein